MYKVFALMIGLLICGSLYGQSEKIRNPVSIGPQLGFYKTADADNMSLMYGAALRLKLSNALGFEGSINYRREEFSDGNVKVDTWPVMLTGMIYPVEPVYGAIGIGWYNTKIDYSESLNHADQTNQKFGWHFGAGTEIPLGEVVALTGDFRYVFLNYDFDEVPGAGEIDANYFVITAGLLFRIQ
ncbi:MAG TPA: outer membrane beta-barrel protein [Ignavibacteriaceae bacterium]|nr:outer membrane beta-barrel protein [Ignavibacteriaceae bacterium]